MDTKKVLTSVYYNKKQRNAVILSILSVILISILLYKLTHPYTPPPSGALRVVICKKCRKTDIQRIYNIKKAKCKFCGGPVAYAWKCNKCQYEYYVEENKVDTSKLNTLQRLQRVVESRRCPNCGAVRDTRPMTLQDIDKK